MTAAGWLQLLFVIALLAISTPLLGRYMAKVYGGGTAPGDRVFGPVERTIYRICGVDPEREQRWTTYALSLLGFSLASLLVLYAQLRIQGSLPLNPDSLSGVQPRPVAPHRGQLPHQHELAELRGRVDHVAPHPDGGARVPQLRVGRGGRGRRRRVDPGPRSAPDQHARQLLGRPRAYVHPRPAAVRVLCSRSFLVSQGVIQNFHSSTTVTTVAGQAAGDPGRSDREPGSDQGDRRERRRPVQRQLVAPVREPEPDHEHLRDLGAARAPVRTHLHVRQAGERSEAGLGRVRHDVRAVAGDDDDRHAARSERAIRASPTRG